MSVEPQGPVLVEGPVEIVLKDGTLARSERFMVAVCTCRRSRSYPWCDTSHRAREKAGTGTPAQTDQTHEGHDTLAGRTSAKNRKPR
ncbi:CDGSH iron-sulfur domain-containing protein [Streptomyces sp. NPDC127072]|uniref:CDGSH iron-sulfur domain-containing protein n=1 Tax=Streptomyces sp. NPDC127072 TaxID=3347129 RepID=UPI00365B5789